MKQNSNNDLNKPWQIKNKIPREEDANSTGSMKSIDNNSNTKCLFKSDTLQRSFFYAGNQNLSNNISNHINNNVQSNKLSLGLKPSTTKNFVNYYSDSNDEDEGNSQNCNSKIISNLFKSYDEKLENAKVLQLVKETLDQSSDNTCLICIGTIKRKHPIWSCSSCYALFHLQCLQTWINDGAYKTAINPIIRSEFDLDIKWTCPKCRQDYEKNQIPKVYTCFCGKVENPSYNLSIDNWVLPHSCGNTCGKTLKSCVHTCLLLCHPGPCPPCPKTINLSCHCGSSAPHIRRCAASAWSCSQKCRRKLNCGHHTCALNCHSGPCPTCKKESLQTCLCGRGLEKRSCQDSLWQCEKICDKPFSCGYHECEKVCHAGPCSIYCPKSGERSCPCGKIKHKGIPCFKDVPCCGQTCDKPMPCRLHKCPERCHIGTCGLCTYSVLKTCRCGSAKRTLLCHKDYICDNKCEKYRNCGVHLCKRKCCNGNCNNCDQVCGATLNCRKHKCTSPCHRGMCYPCPLTMKISCACEKTVKSVPCGKDNHIKPPACKEICKTKPRCHHDVLKEHLCHFGPCPPCELTCNKELLCGHKCLQACHDFQYVFNEPTTANKEANYQITTKKRNAPWEPKIELKLTLTNSECPPCKQLIALKCLGNHMTKNFECNEAERIGFVFSCGVECGRILQCGNHTCSKICHSNTKDLDDQCEICENPCQKSRPICCNHSCDKLWCHPGPCPECFKMVKIDCHCSLNKVYIECLTFRNLRETKGNLERKKDCGDMTDNFMDDPLSCKNRCPKLLTKCGHRCTQICHPPPCAADTLDNVINSQDKHNSVKKICTAKVKVYCPCKKIKKLLSCHQVNYKGYNVSCVQSCSGINDEAQNNENIQESFNKCHDDILIDNNKFKSNCTNNFFVVFGSAIMLLIAVIIYHKMF
ncbi:unnamed protein product [Gordionus sp. m RMFG-2023]|uniref:NF-X1-type zinc finger protein NFXL1-like n=1 Tax=Gordionus sp. m RMFG-2023 TaxID=3053472 RepID=UPI0030DEAC72